jgi:O-antigen ligase
VTRIIARVASRTQVLPIAVASLGICLGFWFARDQWILSLALIACLVILVFPVEATLGIYAFLLPFDSITRLGNSPDGRALTFYVGGLATLALLAMGLLRERLQAPPRSSWAWLGFAAWGIATIFWAIDEDTALNQMPTVLSLLGLYAVAVCFRISRQQLSRVTFLAILGGLAASMLSIRDFLNGVSTIEARSSLIAGSQQADPNIFAASLMIPIALAIGEFVSSKRFFDKAMMLVASLTIIFAVLLTMSRGAVLGLIAMALVFLVRLRPRPAAMVLFTALGCAMTGFCMLVLPPLFIVRFKNALATGGAGRLDIWTAGTSALKHFLLQGAGMGNFEVAYQNYSGFAPIFRGYARAAHNIYLQIAVELGVVGATLFLFAVYSHIRELHDGDIRRRRDPMAIASEAMAVAMLICAFFVGLLWMKGFWMVWIFCAFAAQQLHCSNSRIAEIV